MDPGKPKVKFGEQGQRNGNDGRGKQDRRKTELICTEKAQSVIRRGQKLQRTFFDRLLENMDEQTRNAFFAAMKIMEKNIDMILEETK